MNIEEDCCTCGDPDIGVFGDRTDCQCSCHLPIVKKLSPTDLRIIDAQRKRHEARASREFNLHMIQLFNEGQRK